MKAVEENVEKADPRTIDTIKMKEAKEEFRSRLTQYLGQGMPNYRVDNKQNEFEIRFGTNTSSGRPLSKIDYDNVVKQLIKNGFTTDLPNGSHYLRINYQDQLTDQRKMANVRAELVGVDMIQEYCQSNSLQTILDKPWNHYNKIQFTKKSSTQDDQKMFQRPIDMFDMNFRVSYQLEQTYHSGTPFIKQVIQTWADRKKTFRLMNRVRFTHPDLPVFADISIVRSSKKFSSNKKRTEVGGGAGSSFRRPASNVQIPTYTIQESGVLEAPETYEIELELDNSRVGVGNPYDTVDKIMEALRSAIRIVLCGIQQCYYPISFTERDEVLNGYMKLIRGEKEYEYKKIDFNQRSEFSKHFVFVGPGSVTLQRESILPRKEGSTTVSILENFTVTDKADGERKLLFISEEGKLYLIDNRFNVQFTGMKTDEKTVMNSLLDGELVKFDKSGKPMNLYAAFDIYCINGKSVRDFPFCPTEQSAMESDMEGEGEGENKKPMYRLPILNNLVGALKPSSIVGEKPVKIWKEIKDKTGKPAWFHAKSGTIVREKPAMEYSCKLIVQCKRFEIVSESKSIFDGCAKIMKDVADGLYPYHTDGLIFTPSNLAVGASSVGDPSPINGATWEHSLKWKPAEQNTVDFLVTVRTDTSGKEEITHIYKEGVSVTGSSAIEQYKTLELMCGYNEKTDGFMNPYQDMLDGIMPSSKEDENKYRAELFRPTDPYDANAYVTKIRLQEDGVMVSEEGDYFEGLNIVEFRFDITRPADSRWVPLRVRTDKTQQLRNGEKQFGNAYRVANSNWRSIHYPITEDMITTGAGIPDIVDEGVYYKGNQANNTQGLRDFHNLFVKKALIMGVCKRGDTLIDYAVGMGGDLPKWRLARLGFVFGVDISHSNIHNNKRGACARYLNLLRDQSAAAIPACLFTVGNSALNIRGLAAFPGDVNSKDKKVANAVFGKGPKDPTVIGKAVVAQYGVGEGGFQISSCQFALHYFFENKVAFHGFLRNLAECTRDQGYFIGTCYDGRTIFKMLNKKKEGESMVFSTTDRDNRKQRICEIVKKYNDTGFPDDDTSLGYRIDVYQESINQFASEYLVNFAFFVEMMDNYGFKLVTKDEARQMELPSATGLFSELFDVMQGEIKRNPRAEYDYKDGPFMTSAEKSVSFLNRYFVFRKVMSVDAAKKEKLFLQGVSLESEEGDLAAEFEKAVRKRPAVRGEIKKTKMRVRLDKPSASNFSEATEPDKKKVRFEDKDDDAEEEE
jgi:hypothetical protein